MYNGLIPLYQAAKDRQIALFLPKVDKSTSGVGVTEAPFVNFLHKQNIWSCKSICLILLITFIFDSCHRSWAAMTPVKYKRDIQ